MVEQREWRWVAVFALAIVMALWLPYLVAWLATPPDAHFTGLVYNPLDGHSYIAKMQLGAAGSWRFQLTYTHEAHAGAPVYLFYLLLGHLVRWTGLPHLAVYHGVRTAGSIAFLFGLYRLVAHLGETVRQRRLLVLLVTLGAGLGWLIAPLGRETPDLWVVEAYPFAAALTNAHFPVAMALLAWAAHWGLRADADHRAGLAMVGAMVLLSAIQPFALVPLAGGLGGAWLARILRTRRVPWRGIIWAGLAVLLALPYSIYALWALQADPLLAAWSAQNQTPSPPLWDWLLGWGLVGPLALAGTIGAFRRRKDADGLLLGWLLATVVGLALPIDLARRLSLGLGIALGSLAGLGWEHLARRWRGRLRSLSTVLLVALAALTPLFLLLLGVGAAVGEYPLLYLSDGEWEAMAWLRDHVPHHAVVLCAPETGMFIPAWAGQRVVYGHPFETVDAARRETQVKQYWAGARSDAWLETVGVDYFFYGPREQALGLPPAGEILFATRDTTIYRR
ncbi:MAG: hypothetical protein JW900_07950 [Anaerolineae bacterium]|nr:hypothetical protein [Anaerolineae bacterium]